MGFWEPLFFWILAGGALVSSVAVVLFRNPLYSALALVADFMCFAGLYVLLSAHFLAVIQVLVYGGAIMVLFLFIIMLLNLSDEDLGPRKFAVHQILAVLSAIGVFAFAVVSILAVVDTDKIDEALEEARATEEEDEDAPTVVEVESEVPGLYGFLTEDAVQQQYASEVERWVLGQSTYATDKYQPYGDPDDFQVPPILSEQARAEAIPEDAQAPEEARTSADRETGSRFGTVEPISVLLVNRFVVPFELTAVLLLAAIVGAVIIAKKRL
ncbi:MAG: NADH-quinone oxidoreductase subunit J [Persicimonas sp.]